MALKVTPLSLKNLTDFLKAKIEFNEKPSFQEVSGFASIESAENEDVSFWTENTISGKARNTKAGVMLVPRNFSGWPGNSLSIIRVENPYHEIVQLLNTYYIPQKSYPKSIISPSAKIHETAIIEGSVGENSEVGPYCIIAKGAKIGKNCRLDSNITLYENVTLGDRCMVQAGVVIGSRGFGFYTHQGERIPVPHAGGVSIGNDCEFGANMVVAAGFLAPTQIKDRCKFDSLVQIGHNCQLGNDIYMASQSALAGSTVVEDFVEFAGGAKAAGHLTIGAHARIAAKAGVTRNVAAGQIVSGFPAIPIDEWRRQMVALRKMGK